MQVVQAEETKSADVQGQYLASRHAESWQGMAQAMVTA